MLKNVLLESILELYTIDQEIVSFAEISDGLINETFKVETKMSCCILQSVNTNVFKNIDAIENNIKLQNSALQNANYQLLTPHFYKSKNGRLHEKVEGKTWRVMDFIPESRVVSQLSPESVFEAASAYSAYLSVLNQGDLKHYLETIPGFKNSLKYYDAFLGQYLNGIDDYPSVIKKVAEFIANKKDFFIRSERLIPKLPRRIAHNDAKLTNVLFDAKGEKAIAVIDLDTLQLGSVLDDFGDMVRSMATYSDENERDTSKVKIDDLLLKSVIEGFLKHLKKDLTPIEIDNMFYAAELTILVQAMRFLTDAFQGNTYYKTDYLSQNFHRAINQIYLLNSFTSKKAIFFKLLKKANQK